MGRIDGWLLAMPESDLALKKLGLKNIKRWEYKKYDVKALLPLGEKGKETDKILTELIKKLKANGQYQKIMAPILDQKFDNWQLVDGAPRRNLTRSGSPLPEDPDRMSSQRLCHPPARMLTLPFLKKDLLCGALRGFLSPRRAATMERLQVIIE